MLSEEFISFDNFLAQLKEQSWHLRDQGQQFELAMVALLPMLAEFEIEDAWLWRDWPQRQEITGLDGRDIGIDIVARLRDRNEFWAVQCKFYDPDSTISHGDLGTFFTACTPLIIGSVLPRICACPCHAFLWRMISGPLPMRARPLPICI